MQPSGGNYEVAETVVVLLSLHASLGIALGWAQPDAVALHVGRQFGGKDIALILLAVFARRRHVVVVVVAVKVDGESYLLNV